MSKSEPALFAVENLFAWCIASHDPPARTPEQRARMLHRLGIKGYAWGNRMAGAEHLPAYHAEMRAMEALGIRLVGRYVSATFSDEERQAVLAAINEYDSRPQLWVSPGHPSEGKSGRQRAADEASRLRPIAAAADAAGLKLGLYNHAGWFGDPINLIAIIEDLRRLGLHNVGLVHSQHWGHAYIDSFEQLMPQVQPHLLAVTLNGMTRGGDKNGQQFLPVGAGDEDLRLLGTLQRSGWRGPVGLINHTSYDAEARLQDHLDGLAWIAWQLRGEPAAPAPRYRTWSPP